MGTALLTALLMIAGFVVVLALGVHGQARAFENGRGYSHEPRDKEERR
jgi:hypothetical protein